MYKIYNKINKIWLDDIIIMKKSIFLSSQNYSEINFDITLK